MEPSLESIAMALQRRLPNDLVASLQVYDASVSLVIPDTESSIGIRREEIDWVVETRYGHAHREDPDEAVFLFMELLQSQAWFVEEFRGEEIAATWLETIDGDGLKRSDTAQYLTPFDIDEWTPWPDEAWRTIVHKLHFDAAERQIVEKVEMRVVDGPHQIPATTGWLETGLGLAKDGFKWTLGAHRRFVFQCPKGWRKAQGDTSKPFCDFRPQTDGFVLRVQNYFRDAADPKSATQRAMPPESIEYVLEPSDSYWSCHRRTMLFSDQETQMMAIVELFFASDMVRGAEELKDRIQKAMPESLFVPNDWNMTRDNQQN